MLKIGQYQLPSQVFLAPMAGVTDVPFRQICQQYGAGLTTSEMLIADKNLWHTPKSAQRLSTFEQKIPQSMQIVGYDPIMMRDAAIEAANQGAQIIDINMGCPAKKVCKKAAGSALLKDEQLVENILTQVVDAMSPRNIPVTLKIRTGWDDENKNAVNIGKIAENAGIESLAVHGRTRAMRFNGEAEFDTIRAVKEALSIPVIANGDITSVEKALAVKALTGADGVMIGRGAQGQPWLVQQIQEAFQGKTVSSISQDEKYRTVLAHIAAIHAFYGDFLGLRIARKHVTWYLQSFAYARSVSKAFNAIDSTQEQLNFLQSVFLRQAKTH